MRNVSFLPVTVPYCWLRAGCMIETKEQKVVLMVMSLTLWMASYYCGTAVTVPVWWLIFYTLLLVYPLWMYELCLHVFVPYFVHYITISVCPLFLHSSFLFRSVSPLFIAFMKPSLHTKLCQAIPPRRRIIFAIVAKTDECYKNYIVWRMSGTYTVSWTEAY